MKFCDKVVTKKSHVTAQSLPPTSAACKYHSLRVYYQVQQWKGVQQLGSPSDWGWDCKDGLLKVIRCNCHGDCSSLRCSCRKHGFECTTVCGQCRGTSCSNSSPIVDYDITSDDISQNMSFILYIGVDTRYSLYCLFRYIENKMNKKITKNKNNIIHGIYQKLGHVYIATNH